jgi:hypothetical protein
MISFGESSIQGQGSVNKLLSTLQNLVVKNLTKALYFEYLGTA